MATETKKGLFEELYKMTDEAVKNLRKPLVKKQLKRALESAWDDAEDKKLKAEENLIDARKKFKDYDVNDVLANKKALIKAEEVQKAIEEEYLTMFGINLP